MDRRRISRTKSEGFPPKGAVHERVRQMLVIERLCSRFHLVARQLRSRYADRETLRVEDEHDVQDLLHALLTLEHDAVQPEVWTPGDAGGSPRTDFWLKLERIIVQARLARTGLAAIELKEQLSLDVQKYQQHPDCQTLVCFIYDPERRIANPREVENALSQDRDGLTVRVLIAPRG